MKILVVGDGHSTIHEVAVANAFENLGHEVYTFYWKDYFKNKNLLIGLWYRLQNKFIIGPIVTRINKDLLKYAVAVDPDLIFIYRGTHIVRHTLIDLKSKHPNCDLFGYNNDDPFAKGHHFWLWRHFMKCVAEYDLVFAYRKHNIQEYYDHGAKRVKLLMPWFIPGTDRPKPYVKERETRYDVLFVGHYEADDRIDYIKSIAESDLKFGLFGPDWARAPRYSWLDRYQPVSPLKGENYQNTICSSKIVLCFLSKLNRDTYTRRCFEIPAMGVFMLCQYSDDLALMFDEDVDVVFFRSPEDMMEKIQFYTKNNELRTKIATNGMKRVVRDKHDVLSRVKYVCDFVVTKG